jgi:hypothetical protein
MTGCRFLPTHPKGVLPELLGSADIALVTLKECLGRFNVPSKTYSIMAVARPVLAAVPEDSEMPSASFRLEDPESVLTEAPLSRSGFRKGSNRKKLAKTLRLAEMHKWNSSWKGRGKWDYIYVKCQKL